MDKKESIFKKDDIKCLISLVDEEFENMTKETDEKSRETEWYYYYQDRGLELINLKEKLLYYYKKNKL